MRLFSDFPMNLRRLFVERPLPSRTKTAFLHSFEGTIINCAEHQEKNAENMEKLIIDIYDVSEAFIVPNLTDKEYKNLFITELSDIDHYTKLEQFFSGSVHTEYVVEYAFLDKETKGSGEYSSIYSFLMDLEEIRRNVEEEKIKRINLELSNLNDSNVRFNPEKMKQRDEDAKIVY